MLWFSASISDGIGGDYVRASAIVAVHITKATGLNSLWELSATLADGTRTRLPMTASELERARAMATQLLAHVASDEDGILRELANGTGWRVERW